MNFQVIKVNNIKGSKYSVTHIPAGHSKKVDGITLYNKSPVSMPDIDVDFARNDEMKELLVEKWGDDAVVPISNWNTLQLKSLIKDISKFYEIEFSEVNRVTKVMVDEATGPAKRKHGIKAGVYDPTWEEVLEFSSSLQGFLKKYPQVGENVKILVGQIRSQGKHAGGLIVGENLNRNLPLVRSKGTLLSPFSEGQNVRHLEPLGFIKFDILGLESLALMEDTIKNILVKQDFEVSFDEIKHFYNEFLHPDVIDINDRSVYQNVYHEGNFVDTFQFTQKGAQNFCQQACPERIEEIAAVTSLYRPGPLANKMHESYIEVKKRPHSVSYPCKEYKEVTKDTYGQLVFQEQISEMALKFSDKMTSDDAQKLRKLLTKKEKGGVKDLSKIKDEFIKKFMIRDFSEKNAKKLKDYYLKFVGGAKEKGIDEEVAEKIWNTMEEFAGYAFNKCLDGDTPVETRKGIKKIKDVEIGDFVNSENGFVKVNQVYKQGVKKTYKIKTKGGRELVCTLDHKLETKHGMKTLREIIQNKYKIVTK